VIAYRATLDVSRELAQFVGRLLQAERRRLGTPKGSRALSCFWQAVLGLRWFRQDADVAALGRDHGVSRATAYRYRDEVIRVLAEQAPDLAQALQQAKDTGHAYVILDGKVFSADRSAEQTTNIHGETIDLWYSGKAGEHGGNIQALSAPNGFPLWVSDVEPGSTHDLRFPQDRGGMDYKECHAGEATAV
jgi:DDE superfamily endonuclease